MGIITPTMPTPGDPRGGEELDLQNAVQALLNEFNGNIDAANLKTGAGTPPLVSALPVSPVDGQEVYYQSATLAGLGVIWHLRYRAGSASAYKWEFLGGAALEAHQSAGGYRNSFTWGGLTTGAGPSVTLPLAGDYELQWGCQTYPQAGNNGKMGVVVGGASGNTNPSVRELDFDGVAAGGMPGHRKDRVAIVGKAAATTIWTNFYGVLSFPTNYVSVLPVRVG